MAEEIREEVARVIEEAWAAAGYDITDDAVADIAASAAAGLIQPLPARREDREEDGPCQRCGGSGCPACDARLLDWDVRLVAELSREFPTTTVPLLAEIVAFVAAWEPSIVGVRVPVEPKETLRVSEDPEGTP